jgi:carboxypeptidase Taq
VGLVGQEKAAKGGPTVRVQAAYDELIRRVREQSLLGSCAVLLSWDEETHMPGGGAEHRGEQMALLAGLEHDRATDPRVGELLTELEGSALVRDPLSAAAVNVRELRRTYDRATRLPRSLVAELARSVSLAQQAWLTARRDADFVRFRPWLDRMVTLKRREAECLGYPDAPYDALLEDYEPGTKSRDLARMFDALRRDLVPLIQAVTHAPRRPDVSVLRRCFPLERQRTFVEMVVATIGFDFRAGRLDEAAHPFFTSIGPGDCRITTHYDTFDFRRGLFAALHETGHALYEQGLDPEHHGTPMGEAASLGLHESQARLWENPVGRSRAFWTHFFPLARGVFHDALGDVDGEAFHFAVNHVEATPTRVGADELTYNLHVLVRFELEQALLAGDLKTVDVPAAWNEAYRHYLGVVPANDAEGCLQDSHWAAGLFGYFPSYTLGNVFAAQLFARAARDLGDLGRPFARGDFGGLLGWLRDKVYRHGSRFPAARLIEEATGAAPDHRPLVRMLRRKYGELYGV